MKFVQNISEQVWNDTYKWETDKNVNDSFLRTAKHIATNEKKNNIDYYTNKYYEILSNNRYVPGGRILSNAGTGLKNVSFINCFGDGFRGYDQDSLESIFRTVSNAGLILKSEGGYGFCANVMRPRGEYISGVGVETCGGIEFLKLWNTTSDIVTKGSGQKSKKGKNKIRKGAMMVTLSVEHPNIEEFISSKREPGALEKFNESCLIPDDFIKAVENHSSWNLWFPEIGFEKYKSEWDGNFKKWKNKGYPIKIYKTFKDANELWNLIMKSTYEYAEPGIIFIDRVNELNNMYYTESILTTNACGEQPLPIGNSCNLGSINLTQYINESKTDFDYNKLKNDIPIILRFQDSIIDLTHFPLDYQKEETLKTRRVGIGYMGYGSSLYILKLSYGSKEALSITKKLLSFVTNELYKNSALLAKEKGIFKSYNKLKYLKSKFVKQALTDETISYIKKYGLRNSHLTTQAPTGNTGILSNNVSTGIEPVISPSYIRTIICNHNEINIPKIDWDNKKCDEAQWKFITEGKDTLLKADINNKIYKIDKNRGLTSEENVYDYAVFLNKDEFEIDEKNKCEYIKTIYNLSIDEHIDTMSVFAKYIDSAISKTVNIPIDCTFDDFKNVYMKAYNTNYIKGLTTYREGTMMNVVKISDSKQTELINNITTKDAPKRPKELKCDIHRVTIKGEKWITIVGLFGNNPYELFAGKVTEDIDNLVNGYENGFIVKNAKKHYSLKVEDKILIENLASAMESDTYEAITRMISTALRHGTPIQFIIEQLNSATGTLISFEKSIARCLKKYIEHGTTSNETCPECGNKLIYVEGCKKCLCGAYSKCG